MAGAGSPTLQSQETTGVFAAVGFVCLAAVRDVYLGGLFQRLNPFLIMVVAFALCTAAFLPALFGSRDSIMVLRRKPAALLWINATSATAWIAFMFALTLIEPCIVQIIYSGIGPLSIIYIESKLSNPTVVALTRPERFAYLILFVTLAFAAMVVLTGQSGLVGQPLSKALLGVIVAMGGGLSISVVTMLCRRLNDAGVSPSALLSLRFPATVVTAAALLSMTPSALPIGLSWINVSLGIAVFLIVAASYVNQLAFSLASPLTVRVILAAGPILIFLFQMIEHRLSASRYSLVAVMLYGFATTLAALARQRAIRATVA